MARLWASVALAIWGFAAGAEDWRLAGHLVRLEPVAEGGFRLIADGAVVLEDGLIMADSGREVPGGAIFYGVAGAGGNACDASPFVLWLPDDGAARLDGPIETCAYLTPQFSGGQVAWSSDSLPGRLTEHWTWTEVDGIVAAEPTPFAPDAGTGWADLARLDGQHPAEALRLEPVHAAAVAALGADFQPFGERISGLGSGGLVGADYFGSACIKEVCDTDFAAIWLDSASRQAFLAWADSSAGGVRYLPADKAEWPEAALAKLAEVGG